MFSQINLPTMFSQTNLLTSSNLFWRDNVFGFAGILGVPLWKGDVTVLDGFLTRKVWCDVTSRYIDSGESRDALLRRRNNMAAEGW
jgi:hypothetical protein